MDADALLAATYRGDLGAFEALVRSEAGRLRGVARRIVGDASLADDVLQETFLRILRVPAAARPSRAAAAWLSRVTVRVALNTLEGERSRRRREERYARERSGEMDGGASIGSAGSRELERPVADALASLSPETRAALWLHVVEGDGVREVAAVLDSSRSAVSRRIRAGLEALRARLTKAGVSVAGVAALRGALRGSEIPAPESLVRRIVDAGRAPLEAGAASAHAPDALDRALAAPVRSSASTAWVAGATAASLALAAALGWILLSGPGATPQGKEVAAPVVVVPAAPRAAEIPDRAIEKGPPPEAGETPPSKAGESATFVSGTVRDEGGAPVASADVYLAMHPPAEEDMGQDAMLGHYFRPDYYRRSRFLATTTDAEGRYAFEGLPEARAATLFAFHEGHAGAGDRVTVERGGRSEVDLVIAEGGTLVGSVSAADGSPVADAVVSVCQAWSPTDHIFRGAGLGPTDADGRFRVGLGAGTTACHLRVSSETRGQRFFPEVPVAEGEVELTFGQPARVEGTITWTSGTPAAGLTVRATGRLSEPPIPIERMGLRPTAVHDGLVGADGAYAVEGLHPGLTYDIFVIDGALGEREAAASPLSPRMQVTFRLEPGETKVWDHAVPSLITIRGRIRTELTGTPVHEGQVGFRKDGKRLALISVWADAEGAFEARLNTGPGEYRVHAQPPVGLATSEAVDDLIDARFGRTVHLSSREEVELDLTIFEPAVLPVRVLDSAGVPVESIRAVLHATFAGDRRALQDAPFSLDDSGRTRFTLYFPTPELWYEIGTSLGGPTVETRRHEIQPGTTLPEETLVLPRTCDVAAALLDGSGAAFAKRTVYLRATYEDGSTADLGSRTDERGRLEEKGRLRAAPFVLEIRSADSEARWRSERLDGSAGGAMDLGAVVLEAGDE